MKMKIIDFLSGTCVIKVEGNFPERIINIAKEKGIFIQNITPCENSITFMVSRKGAKLLTDSPIPENIHISIVAYMGLPHVFAFHKSRLILLFTPVIIFIMLFLSTQVIWHVNVIDDTTGKEEHILSQLKALGVKRGAFKFTIDQSDVKNQMLISNPDLLWLWVDIRGSSAIVKYVNRDMAPEVFNEEEYYNIYSSHDAQITKIIPTNGMARVEVGDTVLKGQLLIEGIMAVNSERNKPVHATGEVWGNVWEEKTVSIPKKNEIRTPTGEKTEHLSIKFKNFQLKLFINSSILYPFYDIIENNRVIAPFGLEFNKKEYVKVDVTYEDNDLILSQKNHEDEFYKSLTDQGFTIDYTESHISDNGDYISLTMGALCQEPIAAERRMYFGENNSVTDN